MLSEIYTNCDVIVIMITFLLFCNYTQSIDEVDNAVIEETLDNDANEKVGINLVNAENDTNSIVISPTVGVYSIRY